MLAGPGYQAIQPRACFAFCLPQKSSPRIYFSRLIRNRNSALPNDELSSLTALCASAKTGRLLFEKQQVCDSARSGMGRFESLSFGSERSVYEWTSMRFC